MSQYPRACVRVFLSYRIMRMLVIMVVAGTLTEWLIWPISTRPTAEAGQSFIMSAQYQWSHRWILLLKGGLWLGTAQFLSHTLHIYNFMSTIWSSLHWSGYILQSKSVVNEIRRADSFHVSFVTVRRCQFLCRVCSLWMTNLINNECLTNNCWKRLFLPTFYRIIKSLYIKVCIHFRHYTH